MSWLLPIVSFLIGRGKDLFKAPSAAFTQQVVLHVRALSIVLITCIGALALFCVGVSLFIANVAQMMDRKEPFAISAGMTVDLILTVVSLGVLIYSLRRQNWLNAMGYKEVESSEPERKSSPIESAIASLLVDFLEERQNRRQRADSTRPATPGSEENPKS